MANSRDFTGKNRKFTGTKGITISKGTTAERIGSESGEFRFNTTTELMEYYDGTQWKAVDAPPSITSVTTNDATGSDIVLNADGSTLYTVTINGTNFGNGVTVKFTGSTGTEYTPGNITRVSTTQITCTTLSSMGTADDPYDITVTNVSGLSITSNDAFSYNAPPVFVNASGLLGSVSDGVTYSGSTFNASATDAEGNTITYSIVSGSLPGSGLSISSSTGYITGTLGSSPSTGNYPFVVRAATSEGFVERQFSLQVVVPKGDAEYTTAGTFTWTVPSGVTNVSVVCIGAGGASGIGNSGQAGGGGALAYRNGISVTPGLSGTVIVGGANGRSGNNGQSGTASSFAYDGTTTTAGGGGGGQGDGIASSGSAGAGGTPSGTYTGGGNGGAGGQDGQNAGGPGGGGAGGYTGNGGAGAGGYAPGTAQAGSSGSGGGGGGGGKGDSSEGGGGGGGGVGFYGSGSNGAGGAGQAMPITQAQGFGGGGGSGGSSGSGSGGTNAGGGSGGNYGGGQGGPQSSDTGGVAAGGAVRIVWDPAGTAPAFPSTNVNDA